MSERVAALLRQTESPGETGGGNVGAVYVPVGDEFLDSVDRDSGPEIVDVVRLKLHMPVEGPNQLRDTLIRARHRRDDHEHVGIAPRSHGREFGAGILEKKGPTGNLRRERIDSYGKEDEDNIA
jgi:hypothetical protein